MNRMKTFAFALAFALGGGGTGLAHAQATYGEHCPMMVSMAESPAAILEHADELALTSPQVTQLETLRAESARIRSAAMGEMRELHGEMDALAPTRHAARQVLTADQRELLGELIRGNGGMMRSGPEMGRLHAVGCMHDVGRMDGMGREMTQRGETDAAAIQAAVDARWAPTGATLPALLAEADSASPRIVAAQRAADAAEARVPQAGALPDPTLGVGLMNVPVTDPSLGQDMMTMTQVQLASRFPWPGKLPLREDEARLRAEAAQWEVERARQNVLAEVKSLYYRVYFLDRALDITGRNGTLVGDFAELTASKYGVGTGAQPDVLKAQVERSRLADQLVGLREQRTGAVARLNALLGRAADAPLPAIELPEKVRVAALAGESGRTRFASAALADVLPASSADMGVEIPQPAQLERLALEHNPTIQGHVQRVAAQERAVSLARKAGLPDVSVSAGYSHRSGFGDFFNILVSAPVPIFSGRKQDQAIVEEDATLAEHQAMHHAMVDEVNAEITSLTAELRRARTQLVLLDDGILPQARMALSSSMASYQVGRVDFLTLLDAQATLYQHELSYHRLLADFASNLAALERAVGTEVLR